MHHGRRFGGPRARRLGMRWYESGNVLERLEEYRRDLEQELADVSDLIRRIQAGEQPGPAAGHAEPQSV